MSGGGLAGLGVVVTRPEHQADDLVSAIEAAGGRPFRFPVIDVLPRDRQAVRADLEAQGPADLVVFVSANAVQHGREALGEPPARVAAIGPATAARLAACGIAVDLEPEGGFRSEDLLALPELADVRGLKVTIVRGESGRGMLAETLRRRGADVRYLAAYATRTHRFGGAEIEALRTAIERGRVGAAIVMSVDSFERCCEILGPDAERLLGGLRLVAPGARVIKTLQERLPGARCIEARGPGAQQMVDALIASVLTRP